MVSTSVSAADQTTISYFSNTHGCWIPARIVATDRNTGAIQIDKKPEAWLQADDPRVWKAASCADQPAERHGDGIVHTRTVQRPSGLTAASMTTSGAVTVSTSYDKASSRTRVWPQTSAVEEARHTMPLPGDSVRSELLDNTRVVERVVLPPSAPARPAAQAAAAAWQQTKDCAGNVASCALTPRSIQPASALRPKVSQPAIQPASGPTLTQPAASQSGQYGELRSAACPQAAQPQPQQPARQPAPAPALARDAVAAAAAAPRRPAVTTETAPASYQHLEETQQAAASQPRTRRLSGASAQPAALSGLQAAAETSAPQAAAATALAQPAVGASAQPEAAKASVEVGAAAHLIPSTAPKGVRYRCPTCNEIVDSMAEAVEHCGATTLKGASLTAADGGQPTECGPVAVEEPDSFPSGECIAYDGKGRPMIVRNVDEDSGAARTFVRNEDGDHSVFGENTVSSLTQASEEKAYEWVSALNQTQVRGLTHELGQRLLGQSRMYHARLKELEKMGDALNYLYFGLGPDCTDKDIDNAYRQKARNLHPDKNGGTDEAKQKFQNMKERYEAIKRKREGGQSPQCGDSRRGQNDAALEKAPEEGDSSAPASDEARGTNGGSAEEPQGGNGGQKSPRSPKKKPSKMEYDPTDKVSMLESVGQMLEQLKHVDTQMKVLVAEMDRVRQHIPPGAYD